jgi:hypothetical protein
MYFPWNWKFGSALSKLRNFGRGGFNPPTLPLGTPLVISKVATVDTTIVNTITVFIKAIRNS